MIREEALTIAEEILERLRPGCALLPNCGLRTIEIAGSARRGKKELDEIDLILIPDLSPPPLPRAVFGSPVPRVYETRLDMILDTLAGEERIHMTEDGPRSKKFLMLDSELSFDVYVVRPPATWGVQFALRTGPRDFSHWIVTPRRLGGALPDGYRVQGGAVRAGEEKIPERELLLSPSIGFDTEEGFLDFLGLDWIEPGERVAKWSK